MGPLPFVSELQRAGRLFIAWQKTRLQAWGWIERPRLAKLALTLGWGSLALITTVVFLKATPDLVPTPFIPKAISVPVTSDAFDNQWESALRPLTAQAQTGTVRRGETLTSLWARLHIDDDLAMATVMRKAQAAPLLYPQPGQFYHVILNGDGGIERFDLILESPFRPENLRWSMIREGHDFRFEAEPLMYDTRLKTITATYQGSWKQTFQANHIPKSMLDGLDIMFDGPNNPITNTPKGTRFGVVYNDLFLDNHFVRHGRLLGVIILPPNQERQEAYWYLDNDGKGNYFRPNGESATQTFIRVPLDVIDVSSEFAALRRHPITGVLRPHNGTDFRAPQGTRVFASANGTIVRKTFQSGYGNYIQIDHGHDRETVYAHLSKFVNKLKVGDQVKKGQLIGYVGRTGLATGPHLHYELKINGVQVNPQTVDLPDTANLTQFQMAQFKSQFEALQAGLYDKLDLGTPVPQTLAVPEKPVTTEEDEPNVATTHDSSPEAQADTKPAPKASPKAKEDTVKKPSPKKEPKTDKKSATRSTMVRITLDPKAKGEGHGVKVISTPKEVH